VLLKAFVPGPYYKECAIRDKLRINARIRAREVRLIDENSTQVGVITVREALEMAQERGLDLVEVAPTAVPPVCRLMDYGKYRYEQTKKEREARKHQKQQELKELRLRPKTDEHDMQVKATQARKFLQAGDKVKFTIRFRGRELAHPDIGRDMLVRLAEDLRDIASLDQNPMMEGRSISMIMSPGKSSSKPRAEKPVPAPGAAPAPAPAPGAAPEPAPAPVAASIQPPVSMPKEQESDAEDENE
jgi:translation initiation factor IF-3